MAQRVRVTFAKEGPLRWVAHLDMMRTWERTIRRAVLPLSYSQGYSPHAKIALAAPLPVGVSGTAELVDIWLDDALPLDEVARQLRQVMPPGLSVSSIEQVPDSLPAMQACLRAARYEVRFPAGAVDPSAVASAVGDLLARDSVEWEEQRGERVRKYDLRATILDLTAREESDVAVIDMHLSLEEGRTGRPAQVLKALGVDADPSEIVRRAIEFSEAATAA